MGDPNGNAQNSVAPDVPDYLASPDAVSKDENVVWRYGTAPDYSNSRRVWKESKVQNHAAGSLPQLVENLVKNWEVEASFKVRLEDWRTIDHQNYTFSMNGGPPQSAEHMLKVGTYNAIIAPNEYYSPETSDFASSHKTFKRMMPTFAWEVVEIYSGPPKVAFKWRHWGVMKNDYVGFNDKGERVRAKAHGGPIEIFGVTVADVDEKVRLQAVDTWMDPLDMFRQIGPYGVVNKEPMIAKVGKEDALDDQPVHNGFNVDKGHEQPGEQHMNGQASRDSVHRSKSTITGRTGHTFVPQDGGCPFASSQAMHGEHTAAINGTNSGHDHHQGTNGDDMPHVESGALSSKSLDMKAEAAADQPAASLLLPNDILGSEATSLPASFSTQEQHRDSSARPSAETTAQEVSETSRHQSRSHAMEDTAQDDTLTEDRDTIEGAKEASEKITSQQATGAKPLKDVPCSIYSSGVTGDVESAIKEAEKDGHLDESTTMDTHGAVGKHPEHSTDNNTQPEPQVAKDAVLPDVGEAVAAPADGVETRKAHSEMNDITPEERDAVMNRE